MCASESQEKMTEELVRFDGLVKVLRERCPWDRAQTHSSLRRHLLEETHEMLEVIDQISASSKDRSDEQLDSHLLEELGDLLYQVWFHSLLASERGAFTIGDVARGMHDKLVRRHPHVFGGEDAQDFSEVITNWEINKKHEKARASVMDGIPSTLPALMRASKVLKRARSVGIVVRPQQDTTTSPHSEESAVSAIRDIERAVSALQLDNEHRDNEHRNDKHRIEERLGELLLAVVELSCCLRTSPEDALRTAVNRVEQAFRAAEQLEERDTDQVL